MSLAENHDPLEPTRWSARGKTALTVESPPVPSGRDEMMRYIMMGCGTFDVKLAPEGGARMAIALRDAFRCVETMERLEMGVASEPSIIYALVYNQGITVDAFLPVRGIQDLIDCRNNPCDSYKPRKTAGERTKIATINEFQERGELQSRIFAAAYGQQHLPQRLTALYHLVDCHRRLPGKWTLRWVIGRWDEMYEEYFREISAILDKVVASIEAVNGVPGKPTRHNIRKVLAARTLHGCSVG